MPKLHIAITVTGKYVVTVDGEIGAGPFDTAAEAIKAREAFERKAKAVTST
jgi:hypothetical protein